MSFFASKYATPENRWYALVIIALGLAIVIMDATILNVSVPYMLRDLNTPFSNIQWAISGYALTIATVLITVGRVGDFWGRKKVFLLGMIVFAAGSFVASVASGAFLLILGRAVIQAVGAAMTLTAALSLLASTFHGRDRALAFGVWGAVAGASASLGPLLGGYLTTYYSWRWSLRINVGVAAAAILGSLFIMESRGEHGKGFDFGGTALSGLGIFCLVFGFIQSREYGLWTPDKQFSFMGWDWPLAHLSVIPFFFAAGVICVALFMWREWSLEKKGASPLLRLSIFKRRGFSIGSALLVLLSLGQFGIFVIIPIYVENVLGFNAFKTGVVFLSTSVSVFVFGIISGYLASRINIKWIIVAGTIVYSIGVYILPHEFSTTATAVSLMPGLIILGMGLGLSASQLNNIIMSSAPPQVSGEASGVSVMMRQIGSSIGVAIIGALFAAAVTGGIVSSVKANPDLPDSAKSAIVSKVGAIDVEAGQVSVPGDHLSSAAEKSLKKSIDEGLVSGSKTAINIARYFIMAAAIASFFLPNFKNEPDE